MDAVGQTLTDEPGTVIHWDGQWYKWMHGAWREIGPPNVEPEPEKELEELKMYAAQLSALDLGSKIDFQAIKSGGKYPQRHVGYLTEVKHNHVDGYTAVRVWPSRVSESKTTIESGIRNKFGVQHTIPYATNVVIVAEPPQ